MMPEYENDSGAEYHPAKERAASRDSRAQAARPLPCRKPKTEDRQVSAAAVAQVDAPRTPIRRLPRLNALTKLPSTSYTQKAVGDPRKQDGVRKGLQAETSRLRKRLEALKDKQEKISHQVHEKQTRINKLNEALLRQTADTVVLADKLRRVTVELALTKSEAIERSRTLAREVADRDSTIDCLSKTIEDLKTRVVCLTAPSLGIRVTTLERDLAFLQQTTAGSMAGGRATPPSSPS